MKKIIFTFFFTLSALLLWGQTENNDNNTKITELKSYTNDLKSAINSVNDTSIINIQDKELLVSDKTGLIDTVFIKIDEINRLISTNNVNDDNITILRGFHDLLINNFYNEYKTAILDQNKKKVQISSNKVLTTLKKYRNFFNYLLKYKNENNPDPKKDVSNEDDDTDSDKAGEDKQEKDDKTSSDNTKIIIMLIVIIVWCAINTAISIALLIIAIKRKRNNKSAKDWKQEFENLKKQMEELYRQMCAAFNNQNTLISSLSKQTTLRSNVQQTKPAAYTPATQVSVGPAARQQQTMTSVPSQPAPPVKIVVKSNYANAKPNSIEFKIQNSNPTFVLQSAQINAVSGDFVLATEKWSNDKISAVIRDKTTYLPATFCEVLSEASGATRIEVVSPGKWKKENDLFMVSERIKIRLI